MFCYTVILGDGYLTPSYKRGMYSSSVVEFK